MRFHHSAMLGSTIIAKVCDRYHRQWLTWLHDVDTTCYDVRLLHDNIYVNVGVAETFSRDCRLQLDCVFDTNVNR